VSPSQAAPTGLLLFRADASPAIGGGHVMRLVALADAHRRRGGRCLFALNRAAGPIAGALTRRGHEIAWLAADSGSDGDAAETAGLAAQGGATALVVDGRFAGPAYEERLRSAGPLIAIDDGGGRATAADILVNPNAGAERADYRSERPVHRLLGPPYALLRPEFAEAAERTRPRTAREPCVLLSFGASDPAGGTARALAALPWSRTLRVMAVLGAHHPSPGDVLAAAASAAGAGHSVDVLCEPPDMARVMAAADAAISAAGGTLLELACLGCPTLAFVVADDQHRGSRALAEAGCLASGGDLRDLDNRALSARIRAFLSDRDGRREMAERARRLVDGRGADRVLAALDQHLTGDSRIEATA
jgi:UDP-2,4-diacetamido-2,4,6-trideoxy-beta-L-altropyranose hydrolase